MPLGGSVAHQTGCNRLTSAHQLSTADMPFAANSCLARSFFSRWVRPIPRSTLGALVNWTLS